MDREEYKSHPIHTTLDSFSDALDQASDTIKVKVEFRTAVSKTAYFQWCLAKSDPNLISVTELNGVNQQLVNARNAYLQHIHQVNSPQYIDNAINAALKFLPYPRIQKIFRSEANEAIDSVRNDAEQFESFIKDEIVKFTQSVEETSNKLSETQVTISNLEDLIKREEGKVNAQIDVWEQTVANSVNSHATEFDQKYASLKEKYDENEQKRSDSFDGFFDGAKSTISDLKQEFQTHLSQSKSKVDDWQRDALVEGNDILSEIKTLYGIVGQTALAGDFIKTANEEAGSYKFYSKLAGFLFVVAPIVLAYMFVFHDPDSKFELVDFLRRVPIAAVFLVPAFYFSTLSQRHRRVEVSMRGLGLKVAAFDAYIATLSTDDARTLKAEMAQVFFDAKIGMEREKVMTRGNIKTTLDQLDKVSTKVTDLFNDVRNK